MDMRRPLAWLCFGALLLAQPLSAQEVEVEEAPSDIDQLLIDTDALVIGTQVSTRCALYDSTLTYLSPLEWTGAEIRLRQYEAMLAAEIDDSGDRISQMNQEAAAIACGSEGLEPFLAFSRQVAQDVIDIGLLALRDIEIGRCSYFADDDFLAAVANAREVAADTVIAGDAMRVSYIEQTAASWISLFAQNCNNLAFDPTDTLPGQIALAVPQPQ